MSAPAGSPLLRARIADRVGQLVIDVGPRALGRELGIASSTAGRRGDDLHAWPASDLLALAADDGELREAVITYLLGNAADGSAARAPSAIMQDLVAGAELTGAEAQAMADGRITADEARDLRRRIRQRREQLIAIEQDLQTIEQAARS